MLVFFNLHSLSINIRSTDHYHLPRKFASKYSTFLFSPIFTFYVIFLIFWLSTKQHNFMLFIQFVWTQDEINDCRNMLILSQNSLVIKLILQIWQNNGNILFKDFQTNTITRTVYLRFHELFVGAKWLLTDLFLVHKM